MACVSSLNSAVFRCDDIDLCSVFLTESNWYLRELGECGNGSCVEEWDLTTAVIRQASSASPSMTSECVSALE